MSDINLNGNYCDSRDSYMDDIDAAAIGAAALIAIGAVAFAVKAIAKRGGKR